jgi:TadE-like protein
VEFALTIGIFMLLFFAVVDLGRMVVMHSAAVTASREAARYGSAVGDAPAPAAPGTPRYVDCAGIRGAARAVTLSAITLADDDIAISYDNGSGVATTAACGSGAGPIASEIDSLDRVVVQVTLIYEPITPLSLIMPPVTVVSTDGRTIVKQP